MEKHEVWLKLPGGINHVSHGEARLELNESKTRKMAVYRHLNNTASFGTYGDSWKEVVDKMLAGLKGSDLWKPLYEN